MPVKEIARYMVQLLRGLAHLHKHKVVHCDVSPQNVFLRRDREVNANLWIFARLASRLDVKSAASSFCGVCRGRSSSRRKHGWKGKTSVRWRKLCAILVRSGISGILTSCRSTKKAARVSLIKVLVSLLQVWAISRLRDAMPVRACGIGGCRQLCEGSRWDSWSDFRKSCALILMSAEVKDGRVSTMASDIYSAGKILQELL